MAAGILAPWHKHFLQESEQYLSQIDAEIVRLQRLRSQVAEAVDGDKEVAAPKPLAEA